MDETDSTNIFFSLEEKNNIATNEADIQKMLEEFTEMSDPDLSNEYSLWVGNEDDLNMEYYLRKASYKNMKEFYEQEYTVKDLLKIYSYYSNKNMKMSRLKKQDLIDVLVCFENMPENFEIVQKRHKMWAYITELLHDPKMKKYIMF